MVNLAKELKIFLGKKNVSMKSIDSFSDKSLYLSINRPCLLPEMYVFTLVRKCLVILPIQGVYYTFKSGICFEWAVPANFQFYSPTFFRHLHVIEDIYCTIIEKVCFK